MERLRLGRSRIPLVVGRSVLERMICSSKVSFSHSLTFVRSFRTPLQEYNHLVETEKLRNDDYQRKIISSLGNLHDELKSYNPPDLNHKKLIIESIFGSKTSNLNIKGIYLYGDVGCGKTMLMDLFYSTLPKHLTKTRLHFHQFMQNLHKRSHQLKTQHNDVIPILAKEIAITSTIICFDEFQVTDVADAMLLRRLLSLLISPDYGVILFATSNRAPDDLYLNGIQRVSFIPCINQIKSQCKVIYLNSPTDYRKIPKPKSSVYYYPPPGVKWELKINKSNCEKQVKQWFKFFNNGSEDFKINQELSIWGRKLVIPKSSSPNVALFSFQQLCGSPKSAGDYLTLATSFHSFIITDIPYLSINHRDQVRRFITFLDAVYDAQGRLAVTSAANFKDLFVEPEDIASGNYSLYKRQIDIGKSETFEDDELVTKHGFDKSVAKKAAMFANDEEKFAFARALSRLTQMSTKEWIEKDKTIY